jgi:hypothetical protein
VTGERDEGIVLGHSGNRVALLSKKRGRIDALFFPRKGPSKLSPGAIISYDQQKMTRGGLPLLCNSTMEHIPMVWARYDLLFLHCLLEACSFFIPVGSGGRSIFLLLEEIYRNFQAFETVQSKKIILCKLLAHLGVHPEQEQFQKYAQILLDIPVDNRGVTDLELTIEDLCDSWIVWSVNFHPQGKWFKAIPFLIKSENV